MIIPDVFLSAYHEKFYSKETDFSISKKMEETIKETVEKSVVEIKKQRGDVDTFTKSEKDRDYICSEAAYEKMKQDTLDLFAKNELRQKELEKKYKRFEEDPFWTNTGNQWLVISKNLYDKGFYDNMSKEEVEEIEMMLEKITGGMDIISEHYGIGMNFTACRSGQKKVEPFPMMSSSEAIMELESATAALRFFGEKYIAEEDRDEFNQLIDHFNLHNSYILEGYESYEEGFNRAINSLYTSEKYKDSPIHRAIAYQNKAELKISIYLGGINHTKEDKELYKKNLAELFKNLQSNNMIHENIWRDLEEVFLDFATDNGKKNIRDYISDQSGYIFEHMKSYWSELAAM